MFNVYKKEIQIGDKTLTLETGKVARQADGAVLATVGGTTVLCAVTAKKETKPGQDFFPLSVHYVEKAYAAGKVPGGFRKREGMPSEFETLTSRLIDRPIRPLFPEGFLNEVQVICTVMSHDMVNPADMVAMAGVSAALTISGVPFMGPIGCARVGYIDGEFVLNPTVEQLQNTDLDLVVAGTQDGVLMVESEAQQLSEKTMLDAVEFGQKAYASIIDGVIDLAEMCAKEPWDIKGEAAEITQLKSDIKKFSKDVEKAYAIQDKQERYAAVGSARDAAMSEFENEENGIDANTVKAAFKKLEADVVRGQIIKTKSRIDGRKTDEIREIVAEVGNLPRTHGSALFTRGETQAIVVTTLGTGQDEQIVDALVGEYRESFMLHYNFPPYSVGECGRIASPGRREIGHGKLAWRAIRPLMPSAEDFPYTVRTVSEITESNGSSSMATVCGTSLSMMDAGVPLPFPVAGIAMGLIKEGEDYAVLSDILGDEDHLGDMDFKVAGTENGITALQMDIKITSITTAIMTEALDQAKDGRIHILGEMAKALTGSRNDVNESAPKITTIKINPDKIREVIGTGGKVIREICEVSGAKIDLDDDGTIKVAAVDTSSAEKAIEMIKAITDEPEVGVVYTGKVVKIMDFGAFVNFMGAKDGLVHISELRNERVETVSDVISEGDEVKVKLIGMDNRGKLKLSMKRVNQETGEDLEADIAEEDAA
ncbi:MAG: polyribonucleotide nucleotidyltransferase [Alphaproteobacteria bacterium]|nr:MAG: polyribonucleotide nucleotidyltransferase [Alphaproteobacteria bacterium]